MNTPLAALSLTACALAAPAQSIDQGPSAAELRAIVEEHRYDVVAQIGTPFAGVTQAWQAPNRAHGLRTFFLDEGVRVRPRLGSSCDWTLELSLAAFGREGERTVAQPVAPVVDGSFVEYRRGDLTEWYLNAPEGLEQGFTLETRPAGEGPLHFVLRIGGQLDVEIAGDQVSLPGPDDVALSLGELWVLDARGRRLEARFEPDPLGVRIAVDDAEALYPVTVDPMLVNNGSILNRHRDSPDQVYGTSVAFHGNLAAIGGPGNHFMTGVVRVLRRTNTWQVGARIVPPAGHPNDEFGRAVSIVDDRLVVGAPGTKLFGIPDAGQVYVYAKTGPSPQDWALEATLPHPDAAFLDAFGSAVALREDGARLYVGAPHKFSGWAYLFVRSGTTWTETATLAPVSGVPAEFGTSIAYDVPTTSVLFGAPATDAGKGQVWAFSDSTTPAFRRTFQPSDLQPGDRFGESIAHQGNWAVFGAPGHDAGAAEGGAAYVWERITSLVWVPRHTVIGTSANGALGRSVDVWTESNGDGRVVVGEPGGGSSQQGAVYVYHSAPTVLTLVQQMVEADGMPGDAHGSSVALDGDVLLAGAPFFDQPLGSQPSSDSGRVCTYTFDGNVWNNRGALGSSGSGPADRYGTGAAVSGNWVAVGAGGDDTAATDGGAVFLFEETTPGNWDRVEKVTAGSLALAGGQFGYSVELEDDELFVSFGGRGEVWGYQLQGTVWTHVSRVGGAIAPLVPHQFDVSGDRMIVRSEDLVGGGFLAPGAATIFERTGTVWIEAAYLDDPTVTLFNTFGTDYTIEGDVAVVGSASDDGAGPEAGMARIYRRFPNGTWQTQGLLRPTWLQAGQAFGSTVDLSGGTLAVSAWLTDVGGVRAGAVYTFDDAVSSWTEDEVFVSPNPEDLGYFGWGLALDGDLLVVGAPYEDLSTFVDHGRAYVYQRFEAGWTCLEELRGSAFAFGTSVDVEGDRAVCGAPGAVLQKLTGSARAYELSAADARVYCTSKVNSQGCTPTIGWSGVPSASAGSGFDIHCLQNRDGVSGTFFYGVNGPKAAPYQGGYLCVVGPAKRTGIQNSGGTPAAPCTGEFHYDFNARIASGVDPALFAGQTVWGQYWSRDAPSSFGSNRSDAIEFVIRP